VPEGIIPVLWPAAGPYGGAARTKRWWQPQHRGLKRCGLAFWVQVRPVLVGGARGRWVGRVPAVIAQTGGAASGSWSARAPGAVVATRVWVVKAARERGRPEWIRPVFFCRGPGLAVLLVAIAARSSG